MFIRMQMFLDLRLILSYSLDDTWYLCWYLVTVKPSIRDHPKWEDLVVTYGRWLCASWPTGGLFREEVPTQLIFERQLSACNRTIMHNDVILLQVPEFFSLLFSCANKGYSILRASLCKILISSFAHKMDFAHNFSVDFF